MKKSILIFGLISGVISSLMMIATVPFMDRNGSDHGYVIGYTTIILSLLLVFFGVAASNIFDSPEDSAEHERLLLLGGGFGSFCPPKTAAQTNKEMEKAKKSRKFATFIESP